MVPPQAENEAVLFQVLRNMSLSGFLRTHTKKCARNCAPNAFTRSIFRI